MKENEEYMMQIGQRIRDRRKSISMTQEELAASVGMTGSAISHIEKGRRNVSRSQIEELAKALKTSPGYIMGWTDIYGKVIYGEPKDPVEEAIKSATREQLLQYLALITDELKRR